MKKLEWLKEKTENAKEEAYEFGVKGKYNDGYLGAIDYFKKLIDQLDEPEVLSQEWIDENKKDSGVHYIGYYVPIGRLHDLLVPKQKKVEVPRFVADILEENTFADLPTAFEELFSANAGHYYGEDVCKWIVSNEEAFARAWLDGFTVEKEQKYYVEDGKHTLLCKWESSDGWKVISAIESAEDDLPIEVLDFELTEQEIKDYDPRYMAFAVKVEEMEE